MTVVKPVSPLGADLSWLLHGYVAQSPALGIIPPYADVSVPMPKLVVYYGI